MSESPLDTDVSIDKLVIDREAFNKFVYTSIEDIPAELTKRRNNKKLQSYIHNTLPAGIPEILRSGGSAIVFVQIATPNYELRKFIAMTKGLDGLSPLFFEYHEDKFTDNNEWKYNLGKLSFENGKNKNGIEIIERHNVIDFNSSKGKKLKEINTLWGQPLVDFHHDLFKNEYSLIEYKNIGFFDASKWFLESGGEPRKYYESFFKLFLLNNVLFENYMLNEREKEFTRNIILPALITIRKEVNVKPLIVPIQPTDIEGRPFWMHHSHASIDFVKKKLHA